MMGKLTATVVVVGAGVAGVTAAALLTNNGLNDIVVLEAQNYIGGRIKGEVVDGKIVDLGAQFVHGWERNPAFEIAQKLGRVRFPGGGYQSTRLQNTPKEFNTSGGNTIPYEKVGHTLDLYDDELHKRFADSPKDDGTSYGQIFDEIHKKVMDLHKESLSEEDRELYEAVFMWYLTFHKIDFATDDLKNLSGWGASQYTVLEGERFTEVRGGMAGLLKAIVDLVPEGIIQLSTPVSKIDWSSAQKQSMEDKVIITCENGDVIEADHVIVTVSASYLQANHRTMFQPSLPHPTQTALGRIRVGGIGKIFLKWEKPFWNTSSGNHFQSFELLWLDSHPVSIKSDKCQKKTKFGKPWWYGIQSLESVYDHPNMLELWLTLDQVEIAEKLGDDEVKAVCHEIISAFLKSYKNIPEPVEIYRTKWLTNPYIRGTYSYWSCDVRKEDVANLGAPLPSFENPQVLFAGEAYARGFISTFHGALLSGLEAASLILKKRGIPESRELIDLIDS